MIELNYYLGTSVILFVIGIYCLAVKRNMIRLIIGIEIITSAANLNFIAFSAYARPGFVDPLGHSFVILSIVIGACVVAVALALVVCAYRHYKTLDVRKLSRLRW
ncbi:NADH-quinone oxidoreductase subunit NuoK [Candidatus Bathyarchaeota archaeon]|nr:NADH-quinone oxidoreductase subunit NuoK [Candidatus Bathyarchaeota archaeon]